MNEYACHLPAQPLQFISFCFMPLPSLLFAHPVQSLSLKDSVQRSNVPSLEEFPLFSPLNIVHSSVFITLITSLHTLHSLLRVLNPFSLPIPPGLESYQIVFIFFSTWHMTGLPSRFISELKPVGIQAGMDKLCLQYNWLWTCHLSLTPQLRYS